MQQIFNYTETHGNIFNKPYFSVSDSPTFLAETICFNAVLLSQQTGAKAIIAISNSGHTVYRLASHRPGASVFAFTNNEKLLQKLSLVWGVSAFYVESYETINDVYLESIKILKMNHLIEDGDTAIHVGSIPINELGSANMIKVTQV